jgi:MOSC domain-containing protein YiiM
MLGREPGGLSAAAYDVAGRQAMSWSGRLLHIHIAKRASLAMEELDEAKLVAGRGIEGDRYFYGTGTYSPKPDAREVTLIEMEVLEAIARGDPPAPGKTVELAPADHRRNLTTIGVPLGHLVGRRFHVGEVVLTGGRLNFPASIWRSCWGGRFTRPSSIALGSIAELKSAALSARAI